MHFTPRTYQAGLYGGDCTLKPVHHAAKLYYMLFYNFDLRLFIFVAVIARVIGKSYHSILVAAFNV